MTLVLAGCSSASQATPPANATAVVLSTVAPTPTREPTPVPSPTPVPTADIKALGDAYLACVGPLNTVTRAENKVLAKATTLKTANASHKRLADALGSFLDCVRTIEFPPEMTDDVHALLKDDAAIQVTELSISRVTTYADYRYYQKIADRQWLAGASDSNLIRSDLGLPPPGG